MEKLVKPNVCIDGDLICYRSAAATDGRQYVVSWNTAGGGPRLFEIHKYKKDADVAVRELEEIRAMGITCTLTFEPEPVQNALKIVKDSIVSLETALGEHTDGLGPRKIFITRGGSFREKEVPTYKQLRDGMRRPAHLEACKDYLMKHYGAVCMNGEYEADDLLAMSASTGEPCVICSLDKDLLQVPGHHFNWVKGEYTVVTELEGWRNLYAQLLTGDTTDGIPGIHGIGPKKAEKILRSCEEPFFMYVEVLKAYIKDTGILEGETQEQYHRRVLDLIAEHMTLLYLIRKPGERWKVPERTPVVHAYNPRYGKDEREYHKYLGLIERVRKVNPDAAKVLEDPLRLKSLVYSGRLSECFVWRDQPEFEWGSIAYIVDAEDTSTL